MKNEAEYEKIEKAKILKSIRDSGILPKDFQRIKGILLAPSDSEKAIERTIKGLSEEDEFALMCRLMRTTTHLVSLEQRPTFPSDYIVPDFLARFQPGCSIHGFSREDSSGFRCLVEVKSTTKEKFKIGGSRLKRLRNFADQFELPLLFAVRFLRFGQNALWAIVDDSNREATTLTIAIVDFITGIRHILWDEFFYMLLPKVHFQFVFDPDFNEEGVKHVDYGTLRELQIINVDQITSFVGSEANIYAAFFEAFLLEEIGVQKQGSVTRRLMAPQLLLCSMVDAVYNFNRLPSDEEGHAVYDASKMLAQPEQELYDILLIEKIVKSLDEQRILGYVGFTDKEAYLEGWRKYGGRK